MVSQNQYPATKGKTGKKKVSSRGRSAVKHKKRSPKKRQSTASFHQKSRRRTSKDLYERRRQARQRQKRAEQERNAVAFTERDQPSLSAGKRPSGMALSLLLIIRLIVLAVGIGAIAGTVLSVWDRDRYLAQSSSTSTEVTASSQSRKQTASPSLSPLPLKQEAASLKQTFQGLAQQQPQLNPGVFILDLDSGQYVNWQGETAFSAASLIKVPILIAFFQAWEKGELRLDEPLTVTEKVKAGGSGSLQNDPAGTQYLALETAAKMIIDSDNTATNMIVQRLGGKEALNQLFARWGLEHTRIRNALPDWKGTNTTTPKELVKLLVKLNQGELVSARSRDRIVQIMGKTKNNSLLSQGLGEGATIAHKTGNIASVVGDVGMIDSGTGKRYFVAIMVERPANDSQAKELIRRYSRETYQYFQKQETNSFISHE